jgi:ankyrin repeat protein
MKKLLVLFMILTAVLCNAQGAPVKDVFDTARRGTVDEMRKLMAINKDTINAVNNMGFTPLILACYRGNNDVAEFLIKNVKDVDYDSSSGTALAAVAVKGNAQLAKGLLERGANPNIADPTGITPLIYATEFENIELMKLLLSYKADKKQTDKEGKTPYDYAVFTNNQEVINLLKN